jgi:hypothetical protein
MTMRQRVYWASVTCHVSFILGTVGVALLTMSNGRAGWPFIAWTSVWGVAVLSVLDRVTRCPFCGARLLKRGLKPDVGRFAYIRCQSCRKRFDGREGPDPEISDEAIARGDPLMLDAYRDASEEMRLLMQAPADPEARRALLAKLESQVRVWEDELRRILEGQETKRDRELESFFRHSLEQAHQEIAELKRQEGQRDSRIRHR